MMGLTADSAWSSRWAKGPLPSGEQGPISSGDLGQNSSRCALNAQIGQCLGGAGRSIDARPDGAGRQERPCAQLVDITLQSITSLG